MHVRIIMLFAFTFGCCHLTAQNSSSQQLPKVVPPSPNVAALQRYGDIPVSAYTGVPGISIPLYQINIGGVSIPISISYHASGIKVADEASRVGLGWALNAGGVISRTIMGPDDFGFGGFTGINYHASTLPDLAPGFKGQPAIFDNIKTGAAINNFGSITGLATHLLNNENFQPDIYNFNFMDYAGKFFLKRNKDVVLAKKEKISIRCMDVNGNAWEVTAADGNRFLFEEYEESTPSGYSIGSYATGKTAWYLTKIVTIKGETVNFQYLTSTNFIQTTGSFFRSENPVALPTNVPTEATNTADNFPSFSGSSPGITYKNLYLDKISFKNGEVKFVYSSDRTDVLNDVKLTDVKIYNKTSGGVTSLIKQWGFNYSYFEGTATNSFFPADDHVSKRLKLESVSEKDANNNALPPYVFAYNTNDILNPASLPTKTSFSRDHWGYYNGMNNSSLLPDFYNNLNVSGNPIISRLGIQGNNRDANPGFAQLFSLKEIKYPAGGKTIFEYESNDFDLYKSKLNDNSFFASIPEAKEKQINLMYSPAIGELPSAANLSNSIIDLTNMYTDPYTSVTDVEFICFLRFNSGAVSSAFCSFPPNIVRLKLVNETGTAEYYNSDVSDYLASNTNLVPSPCVLLGNSNYWYGFTINKKITLSPGKYYWKISVAPGYTEILDATITVKYLATKGGTAYCDLGDPISNSGENVYNASFGGGLRIKKIADYDLANNPVNVRKYLYHFTDNTCGENISRSYGKRMSRPIYSYYDDKWAVVSLPAPILAQLHIRSQHLIRESDSNIPLNGSASGNAVGYDKVTVLYGENGENGKTEFEYENMPDYVWDYSENDKVYGVPYRIPRKPPSGGTFANLTNGNLLKQTDYEKSVGNYIKVKETVNHYNEILGQNNSLWYGIEKRNLNNYAEPQDPGLYNGYFFRSIIYPALVESRKLLDYSTTTVFDKSNPAAYVTKTINYTYNNNTHLQLASTAETSSKGDQLVTSYTYPLDYSDNDADPAILDMKSNARFMHNKVVTQKTTILKNGGSAVLLLNGLINKYQVGNGLINTKEIAVLETNQPVSMPPLYTPSLNNYPGGFKTVLNFNAYDVHGNILEQQKTNDVKEVYLWGYQSQYPVAKILNTTYAIASAGITQATLDNPADDASLRNYLSILRNIPGALVSIYTYKPLVGVTSETDANGKTMYYEYDAFNRLSIIRDKDNNILKKFCYNYANQQVDCAGNSTLPNWQTVAGTTHCKPCPVNATYTNGEQEHQEKDLNPYSLTYNQTRLINDGPSANCPIESWQNTITAIRCQFGSMGNTGYQEQEQKDMNPCSPTYNTTRWLQIGFNSAICNVSCSFTMASGYSLVSSGLSNSAGNVSGYIVFYPTSFPMSVGGYYNNIAQINGACLPATARTFSYNSGSNDWQVTISSTGSISLYLASGPSINLYNTVGINLAYTQ